MHNYAFDPFSWAVGLYEGEGSISAIRNQNDRRYINVVVAMKDEDVIERFRDIVGMGRIYEVTQHNCTLHSWRITRLADCERFCRDFYPHLGLRRKEQMRSKLELANKLLWIEGL